MKNVKKMKSFILTILLCSLFISCSSYNHIQYRNEKQLAKKEVKVIDQKINIELAETEELEKEIVQSEFEVASESTIIDKIEDSEILEKNMNSKNESFKNSKNLIPTIVNKIEKISDNNFRPKEDKLEKSKYRKRFDTFHWILLGLTLIILALIFAGFFESAFLVIAGALFLFGFVLLIIQNLTLPKKISSLEKDKVYRRRLIFARIIFIFTLIAFLAAIVGVLIVWIAISTYDK